MSGLVARGLMAFVRGYRLVLSPWLGNACRFEPTCSVYALDALARHGATVGTALTIGRIARCHPWCAGGHDPVPLRPLPFLTSLLARPDTHAKSSSPDASGSASP